ncbi:hypothetical protein L1987_18720 [Smallanthus sonchifolius]|uniref:Uncharacterized protein n=1 Tax=Smallanthus sonchifolius TaxID=185202 RepID=A0ACB9J0U5_9ASTR|nr:hypothetical protein L1987_18720 [Smallanthus sonchifolius]
MTRCYELVVKEAEEAKQMVNDLQKIATTKNKTLADEAKIKLAKEADDRDFDQAKWDVQEWKRLVAELGGEPVKDEEMDNQVVEAEGSVKVVADVIEQGNEGDK